MTARSGIPRGVWVLGFVSLLMDISSEMIHSLLPVFVITVLGASPTMLGLIEGIAEGTASLTKLVSGRISDVFGRRKLLALIGYGLSAATKPLFPLADTVITVLFARFMDRIGKGIRVAPRDALVADLAPPEIRGAAFGLRQSLDTIGALTGPVLAVVLMALTSDDYVAVFWIAVVPGLLAVALLGIGVREPPPTPTAQRPALLSGIGDLGAPVWLAIGVATAVTLARLGEAFLILEALNVGLRPTLAPLALIVMNLAYTASAYPAGLLSDRIGRHGLIAVGLGLLIAAGVVLAMAQSLALAAVGLLLWGLHMGLTQGLLTTLVADTAPPEKRGSAFGAFHLAMGVATFAGSVMAGVLWQYWSPAAPFAASALLAFVALLGFGWVARRKGS